MVDIGKQDGLIWWWRGGRSGTAFGLRRPGKNESHVVGTRLIALGISLANLLYLRLVLGALRTIYIVGVHCLVLFLSLLRLVLPYLPLRESQGLPLLTDCLGKICLSFFLGGAIKDVLVGGRLSVLAAFTTEEDESILRTLDVIRITFTWTTLLIATDATRRGLASSMSLRLRRAG